MQGCSGAGVQVLLPTSPPSTSPPPPQLLQTTSSLSSHTSDTWGRPAAAFPWVVVVVVEVAVVVVGVTMVAAHLVGRLLLPEHKLQETRLAGGGYGVVWCGMETFHWKVW